MNNTSKNTYFEICNELYNYYLLKYDIDVSRIYPYLYSSFSKNQRGCAICCSRKELIEKINNIVNVNIKKSDVADNGIFFTTIDSTIETLINQIEINPQEKIKILEPSCGIGNIIITLMRKTINELKSKYPSNVIIKTISDSIVGVEINELFCVATEALMLITCDELFLEELAKDSNYTMPRFQIINADFISNSLFKNNSFDYIIGNPPYVTLYGRRSKNMTEKKREYYNNNFDFVANKKGNNKFNYSMFFIEKGIKYLKQGGSLSYLLDISFFETPYKNIRKYILENTYIKSIEILDGNCFNVTSNQLMLTVTKSSNFAKNQSNILTWIENHKKSLQNQYNFYNEKNEYRFFKPFSEAEEVLINNVEKNDLTLGDFLPNKGLRTCCALTGKTDEFVSNSKEAIPYLEGSKGVSNKYCTPIPTKNIMLDYELQIKLSNQFKNELEVLGVKNKKRVTLGDIDAYYYPKLFIRQSATEIIATYTERPFAANNSLYLITYKSNDLEYKSRLKYLLAILNSDIITQYAVAKKIIRQGVGKTPQIKISDLKRIPIAFSEELKDKIVSLVDETLYETDEKRKAENIIKINSLITKVYTRSSI